MAENRSWEWKAFMKNGTAQLEQLLKAISVIPAPSGSEEKRAEFVKKWLEAQGAEGVYIDEAKNVIFPMNCDGRNDITVFAAHTDVVFPDEKELPWREDDKNFYCPGVGDNTVCLATMLTVIKFILQNQIKPKGAVLFVANACEEGLGNLKGTRRLFEDYKGRITRFYTFDGQYQAVVSRCVGSHRYEVSCTTEGGHSYNAFGNHNAIACLADFISDLYAIEVPKKENCKTTYNVGVISGGTSVNTIAQSASMLFEYRSDDAACLAKMEKAFQEKLTAANASGKGIFRAALVGARPCQEKMDERVHQTMLHRAITIQEEESGQEVCLCSGSTDCNIPMSLGVPAVCVGVYNGGGAHTYEEWVEKESLPIGLRIVYRLVLDYFS